MQKNGRALGLAGWVRNLPDGRVEAYAEGAADALDNFEERLRRGPMMAEVRSVDVIDEAPSSKSGDRIERFEIR